MTSGREDRFRLASLATALYLPNLLFSVGRGAVVPVIALFALDLGASPAVAGVVVALRGLGTLAYDLPAGALVARVGERKAMIGCGVAMAVVSFAIWLRPPLWVYAILITLLGATWSVWHIARIGFAAGSSPPLHRGRVMAVTGGSARIGQVVGPLLGGLLIGIGSLADVFLVLALVSGVASVSMALAQKPVDSGIAWGGDSPDRSLAQVLKENRATFATAGSVAVAGQVLRSSREVLIPLWGSGVGLTASTITLVFAVSYAAETLLFYPAGLLMDRRGRKWAFVPCFALLTLGVATIPLVDGVIGLTIVAVVIGLGNGLGSGMNMTLASDLSPPVGRSRFLGAWRLVSDLGSAGGPMLVSAVTAVASLAAAASTVAGVGALGLVILVRLVPETRHSVGEP